MSPNEVYNQGRQTGEVAGVATPPPEFLIEGGGVNTCLPLN